jgi:hypothetical protein
MSLDIDLLRIEPTVLYGTNITHNLNKMADALGVYQILWHPEEWTRAAELIKPLQGAIKRMLENPDEWRAYDAPNSWGTYDDFLPWLQDLLRACEKWPDAWIKVSR